MKNIESILKEFGVEVTTEQLANINKAVADNYRTVVDYGKQVTKYNALVTEKESLEAQLTDANALVEKFKDVDVDNMKQEIADYKKRAEDAEAHATAQILERDQRDFLKAEFDKLGIASERVRKSLMSDIMDEKDGLKWKDGAFLGLTDYLNQENEKDHFFTTKEEEEEGKAEEEAAKKVPTFTTPSKNAEGKPERKEIRRFF